MSGPRTNGNAPCPRTRKMTVIAQDPSVPDAQKNVLTVKLDVPLERLVPGPRGSRVHVIDYDVSNNVLYKPAEDDFDADPYKDIKDRERIESDRNFHAWNAYAIVMATLARFEKALGRRAPFSFPGGGLYPGAAPGRGHVIKVAPHAFLEPNAFYSRRDEGLFFGYFTHENKTVFSCLSHDVIAHETTHSLLDGLRSRFMDPTSADQAAFHEGFADIVAILSVFEHKEVAEAAFWKKDGKPPEKSFKIEDDKVAAEDLEIERLRELYLVGLADQMGEALTNVRGNPLRNSAKLPPAEDYLDRPEFNEEHRRGEVFVAAMLNSFLKVWTRRLGPIGLDEHRPINLGRVVEEAAEAASNLLTMAIRAIDYAPPVDVQFGDFLAALLTADRELYPDDSKYNYREMLLETFASYGIRPPDKAKHGMWEPPKTSLRCNHFDSLQRDPDEAFKFIWENQGALGLYPDAYTYVPSVRPCIRVDVDGFILRETLIEYVQILDLKADELPPKVEKPGSMPNTEDVRLYGGGVLVFDEFGSLKFHIGSGVDSDKQTKRIDFRWQRGTFHQSMKVRRFANLHRMRNLGAGTNRKERW